MSGKFLARASALSLALFLAACGGDDSSTPLVDSGSTPPPSSGDGGSNTDPGTPGGSEPPTDPDPTEPGSPDDSPNYKIGYLATINDPSSFVANEVLSTNLNLQPTNTAQIGGEPVRLQVAVLDAETNQLALSSDAVVTFFSACAATPSGLASFGSETVPLDAGIAITTYSPTIGCLGPDVIYARVNDDRDNLATVTLTNQLSGSGGPQPSTDLRVGTLDSSGGFTPGEISAARTQLVTGPGGIPSTQLRFAIVDENNDPDISLTHNFEFVSMCLDAGLATVDTSGSTRVGEALATYHASAECLGTDRVYVFVGENNQLRASVDLEITANELVIGSLDGAGMFQPNLRASKSELNYNHETEPATEIHSAVGTLDASGNFTPLTGSVIPLEFFSMCLDSGRSIIETTGSTESGELTSTYRAQSCLGGDTIWARISDTDTMASVNLNIIPKQGQELALGYFDDAGTFNAGVIGNTRTAPLPTSVQTKLYLSIVDAVTEVQTIGQPLTVEFNSLCADSSGSESPLSADNASVSMGYIELLYTAKPCSLGEDTVWAQLSGVDGFTATAQTTITLAELPANSLTAGLPQPNSIAPSWYSTEGRETTSSLWVQLKDNQGYGVAGETVQFTLDNPGSTDVAVLEPVDGGLTDAEGYARVEIKALEPFDNVVRSE